MDILEQEIWKTQYLEPMFERYKEIPIDLKYKFIEKDYIKMFGKRMAQDQMRYMYDDSETFIFAFENALCEFSKRVKKNILKKYFEDLASYEYYMLKEHGMFYEYWPNLSGEWKRDEEFYIKFIAERENKKEYIKLLLE